MFEFKWYTFKKNKTTTSVLRKARGLSKNAPAKSSKIRANFVTPEMLIDVTKNYFE